MKKLLIDIVGTIGLVTFVLLFFIGIEQLEKVWERNQKETLDEVKASATIAAEKRLSPDCNPFKGELGSLWLIIYIQESKE